MEIVQVKTSELVPYERNAKEHPQEQVEHIANSIKAFGFRSPIVAWKDGTIINGHGRLLAAYKLGLEEVPVIYADDLTEEEANAFRLADNKTAESSWDEFLLADELADLFNFGMERFGFEEKEGSLFSDSKDAEKYSQDVKIPQYEIVGDEPTISELFDNWKTTELIEEIQAADIPDDVRDFLIYAAYRHTVFNYRNIAEFYAHQTAEVQRLMEKSALVIIDINDAIANGYAKLANNIFEMRGVDDAE